MEQRNLVKKINLGNLMLLIAQYLFAIIFCILTVQITFATRHSDSSFVKGVSVIRFIEVASVIGVILALTIFNKNFYIKNRVWSYFSWNRVLWGVWLVLQYLYVWGTYSELGSDAWIIHSVDYLLLQGYVDATGLYYFAQFTNNINLGFFGYLIQKAIPMESKTDMWLLMAVIAALFADIAIYWTLKLITKLYGKRYFTITFLVCIILIGLSEEATVLYSDIVSLWTIPFTAYHVVSAENGDKKIWVHCFLAGVGIGFGGAFKPQVFILLIAGCIVVALQAIMCKVTKHQIEGALLCLTMCLVVYVALSSISKRWYYKYIPDEYKDAPQTYIDENTYPMLHWVNMGLNSMSIGDWNQSDCQFTESFPGKENKNHQLKIAIQERLENFGLVGYLKFVNRKVVLALQNGSFSHEAVWKGTCLNTNPVAIKIQHYFVSTYDEWKHVVAVAVQEIYLLCLWSAIWNVLQNLLGIRKKSTQFIIQIAQITLLGDIMFLALFERNVRYFYTVIPLLILLAIAGLRAFIDLRENEEGENNL